MHFKFFVYYAHFYASQIQIMQTNLQIMVKIDQEEPLLDYHSFLIGQPFSLKICIRQKAFQIMPKIVPSYYAAIMPYAFQSLLC